jgi:hypothetical protein
VLAKCLPGFTLQAFRDAVSGAVSVGLVLGEWTDFDEPVLIGFEKMPQEGDSLNGISGRECHDVYLCFPSRYLLQETPGSYSGGWQSQTLKDRFIHIIHQKQNPLRYR